MFSSTAQTVMTNSQNFTHPSAPVSPRQVTATVLPARGTTQPNKGCTSAGSISTSSNQQDIQLVATTEMTNSMATAQQSDNTCEVIHSTPQSTQTGGLDIADLAKAEQNACQPVPSGRASPPPTLISGTHGILRSPGPTGPNAFMSVESILVPPSLSQPTSKDTQTYPGINVQSNFNGTTPSSVSNNRPTMLTALLKGGTINAQPNVTHPLQSSATNVPPSRAAQSSAIQQQVVVSHLLHSLVNQSPIPTPATFKKQVIPAVSSKKANQVMIAATAPAPNVPPKQVQRTPVPATRAMSLGNGFNPSVFLANPAQLDLQQIVTTSGAILPPNAFLPSVPYLNPFSTIYGSGLVPTPSTCGTINPSNNVPLPDPGPTPTTLAGTAPVSMDADINKPSPPKKPRVG